MTVTPWSHDYQERVKEPRHKLKRLEQDGENYELSRWVPVVKDIAEVSY